MGTSTSSKGPASNVPLVPPWVPPLEPMETDAPPEQPPHDEQSPTEKQPTPILAQPRRFAGARTSLGSFARNGSRNALETGLGHYTRSGLGGARRAAQRMGGTARTAGALFNVLSALRGGEAPPVDLGVDPTTLAGRPAREIADRIIDAIRPIDGTQDTEASRDAIALAIADLMDQEPDVNLAALDQEQIERVTERYVAHDLCHRIELDVGKAVLDKAPDAATGFRRLEEIKQYIQEKVSARFRARRERGERMTRRASVALTGQVLRDTFEVFEEYV